MDFRGNFLKHNANKVALKSFLTGRLLTQHDFDGSVIIFISVNSEVKCNSTDVRKEDLHNGHTTHKRWLI